MGYIIMGISKTIKVEDSIYNLIESLAKKKGINQNHLLKKLLLDEMKKNQEKELEDLHEKINIPDNIKNLTLEEMAGRYKLDQPFNGVEEIEKVRNGRV
jgi:hypothetical protein